MKRRHVIATVMMGFIPGCQLQSGVKKQESNKNEVNINFTNNNDKNIVVDISIVKNGSLVYVEEISIQANSQKNTSPKIGKEVLSL